MSGRVRRDGTPASGLRSKRAQAVTQAHEATLERGQTPTSAGHAAKRPKRGAAAAAACDAAAPEATPYDRADAYRVMRAKLLHDGLAGVQTNAFNDFMYEKIPRCLSEHAPIVVVHEATDSEHVVELLGVRYDYPTVREATGEQRYITPHECHIRRLTYSVNLLVTARYMIRERSSGKVRHSVIFRDKQFDRIPCMKYSDFCASRRGGEPLIEDQSECGGYFISTGAEKVIIGQEGPRNNYPFVMSESDGGLKCEFRSFNEIKYRSTSTLYIHLAPPYRTADLEERRACVPRVTVRIPYVSDPLPLPIVFKLLGVLETEAMLEHVVRDDDPAWFRARALDALLSNVDAVVLDHEYAVTRLAHDRGQSYQPARRRRGQEESQAARRRRKRQETETEYERCQKQVAGLLASEFLPHQGYAPEAMPAKRALFGLYVRKLLRVFYGLQEVDNRDHYMHRRVALVNSLMALLFRKHFTMWRRRLASQIRRELDSGAQYVNIKDQLHANIGGHLQAALSTGNFSMQRGQNNMEGVAQVLCRTEPHAAASHVNRTSNPMNKDGRAVQPRLQDASCMGVVDPWDTPEGQSCGLMRNKALLAGVRIGYSTEVLAASVLATGLVDAAACGLPLARLGGRCPVFVSGQLVGCCSGPPEALLRLLRDLRACRDLPFDVSIYRTSGTWATLPTGEIHVNGDPGSFWWPLLRVDRLPELRATLDHITNEDDLWTALLAQGIVEVMNKDEEAASARVALDRKQLRDAPPGTFTHMVIDPSQICSIYTAKGPLLEFNQAPRVTYQAAMGKQAIGRAMTNSRFRVDTAAYHLWYPQRGLVTTFMDEVLSPDGVASLQNPTVAILCQRGYNVEDSIIFNRRSLDMGLFRSSVTRSVRDVVRSSENEVEELGLPPEGCCSRLHANYSKVNPATGVVEPGTIVERGDVLVAKFVRMTRKHKVEDASGEVVEVEEVRVRDRSMTMRTRETAIVEDVIFSKTLDGETTVRVKTRADRHGEVGDKYASRYGQKGTIGAIFAEADMPFNPRTGVSPDLMINAHAIPSRMTIGHMLETVLGKAAALQGRQVDGTPFAQSEDVDDSDSHDAVIDRIAAQLERYGYSGTGSETLVDGRTGHYLRMRVFVGPLGYEKLKHMVSDKYHARSRGPKQMQTQQPVEGRQRDGGQRVGEMEHDCFVAHGAAGVLQERLLFSSDKANVPVCVRCGDIAQPPKRDAGGALFAAAIHADKPFCHRCLDHDTVINREIPFAYKLSVQELEALHLSSAFEFSEEPAASAAADPTRPANPF